MDIINLFLFLTATGSFIFGLPVFFRSSGSNLNRSYALVSVSLILWSLTMIFYRYSNNTSDAIFWCRALYISALWMAFCNLLFTKILLGNTHNVNIFYILFLPATATIIFLLRPDWLISDVFIPLFEEKEIEFGLFYYVFYLPYIPGYFLWSHVLLWRSYRKSMGLKKSQIVLVLAGTFFASSIGMVTNLALPTFGVFEYNWFAQITIIIYLYSMGYAITRYRLMDIRAVIARTIAFGFIVALLVAVYAVISALIALLFENIARVQSNIVVSVITSLFVVLGYSPLRKFIEKITETFLFKKTYDPDKLLAKVTEVTSSILDLNQLLSSLSAALGEAFHFEKFGVALMDDKNKMDIFHKEGFKPGVAEALTSYKGVTTALYKELERTPGLLVIDEMKTRADNGEFVPADPVLLNMLHENDIAVIAPLHVKDRLIGIFAIGNKKSGDSYNTQDLNVIRITAGQAGVAIENARLYEELKTFNVRLEREVRQKTLQLRRANSDLKVLDRAKSEFISIASHQLRTPLTIIKGYISMMQEGSFGEVPKPIADNLRKVFISNERLIQLVEDLLDISRIESGRQEFTWVKIRLENLAQTVVENLMQNATAKNLKLTFHKPDAPTPEVVADENKLHEVMMNFVDNAIKYTPSGQIDVTVRVDKGDLVTFCVKDSGKGITPELQDVLFKKFSRGKDSFRSHTEGLGLGLYVAKLMMDAHKGKIWAESDGEGLGSSFCFSIPVKGVELPAAGAKTEANLIKKTETPVVKK